MTSTSKVTATKLSAVSDPVPYWRTTFSGGEARAIAQAIADEHISQGPVVAEFERQLAAHLGVPYAVATTSGSMALLMSLWAAGIRPGDEVIVPDRTWIATAHAAVLLGASVKLVDVERDRPIIDASLIERNISRNSKAIIPVHLCGRSADMPTINSIAQRHGLIVIEDAAQALGSRNRDGFLGTQSDMGCYSFSVAKIISTGQGGVIVTRSAQTFERLVAMRTHGVGDVINAVWDSPGFNFRFTDILATIGIEQLKLLSSRIEKVKSIYHLYERGIADLPHIRLIPVDLAGGEIPVYVEALCDRRDELVRYLAELQIQCRPFYPDLHQAGYLNNRGKYPNSERFARNGLYLPAGPEQPISNIERVISALHEFG